PLRKAHSEPTPALLRSRLATALSRAKARWILPAAGGLAERTVCAGASSAAIYTDCTFLPLEIALELQRLLRGSRPHPQTTWRTVTSPVEPTATSETPASGMVLVPILKEPICWAAK